MHPITLRRTQSYRWDYRPCDSIWHAIGKALLGIVVLVLSIFAFGGTSPAQAQPTELPDSTAQASLTVHKYVLLDGIDPNKASDGTESVTLPPRARPYANITFTARRVYSQAEIEAKIVNDANQSMDLYEAVSEVTGSEGYYYLKDDETLTATTDARGAAVFDLTGKQGVYVVSEQPDPRIEIPSEPFMVSVPMVDPNDTSKWLYDVHVFPKNYKIDVNKYIIDSYGNYTMDASYNAGEAITFCVTSDVPSDIGTDTQFLMTDKLDWRLTIADPPTELTVKVGEEELTSGTDYTASVSAGTDNEGHACQILTVDLIAGKDKLQAAFDKSTHAGNCKVSISFVARLNDNATYGSLYNGATFDITNSDDKSEKFNTPQPEVAFAQIVIDKSDVNDSSKKLEGAHFRIAQTYDDAINGNWLHRYDKDGADIGPYEVITDENGAATFTALHVNLNQGTDYYLVETGSPEGYEPFTEPIKVSFDRAARSLLLAPAAPGITTMAASSSGTSSYFNTEALTKSVAVPNYPIPELPGTGGVRDNRVAVAGIGAATVAVILAAVVILTTRRHAFQ